MKTFKQFIAERRDHQVMSLDEAIEEIRANCKEFLKHNYGQFFYRGDTFTEAACFIFETRPQRDPLTTNKVVAETVDNYMLSKFGHRFRTQNVLFGTRSNKAASYYGRPYVVFPYDGYTLLYSEKTSDLWADALSQSPGNLRQELTSFGVDLKSFSDEELKTIDDNIGTKAKNIDSKLLERYIKAVIDGLDYTKTQKLPSSKQAEVMVHVDRAVLIDADEFPFDKFEDLF